MIPKKSRTRPPASSNPSKAVRMGGMPVDHMPAQLVAETLRRARNHTDELLSADLVVAGGDTVRIVCVTEVQDWLAGLAAQVEREGLKLRASEPGARSLASGD
jgi:hypothetical protein